MTSPAVEETGRFRFWCRWLLCASIATAALGLLLALADTRLMPEAVRSSLHRTFWNDDAMPEQVVAYHRFLHGVLGGTLVGWGITLAFIAARPFRAREPWAWWCVLVGTTTWFVLDTGISALHGAWANGALNTGSAVALLLPVVATRRSFP